MKAIQCRMGRAALGWSTQELAAKAGVGGNTVNRFEAGQDARVSSVDKMKEAMVSAGIMFIPENAASQSGGAGIRLKAGETLPTSSPKRQSQDSDNDDAQVDDQRHSVND